MGGSGSNQNPEEGQTSASQSPSVETGTRVRHILIVEDNKADVTLIRKALRQANVSAELHELDDGEKAIRFFERADADLESPCPDLILLDINIPRYRGGEILRRLRSSQRCGKALVLIVTSSDSERDRQEMYSLGANGYFRKPFEFAEYMKLGLLVRDLLALGEDPSGPSV
ncbi:MAG TPA: response regulator [Bryobacteraceae bacterium]|jgi:CheY-like chemotaxis protein